MRSGLFIDYIFKAFIEKFQKRQENLKKICQKRILPPIIPKAM